MTGRCNAKRAAGRGSSVPAVPEEAGKRTKSLNRSSAPRAWSCSADGAVTPGALSHHRSFLGASRPDLILRDQCTKAAVSKQVCTGTFWLYWGIEIGERGKESHQRKFQTSKVFIREIYRLNASKHNWLLAQVQHKGQIQT